MVLIIASTPCMTRISIFTTIILAVSIVIPSFALEKSLLHSGGTTSWRRLKSHAFKARAQKACGCT